MATSVSPLLGDGAAPRSALPGLAGDAAAPAPLVRTTSCADWYSAQIQYEAAGGLAADPGYVDAVDADRDGIACEEAMVTG